MSALPTERNVGAGRAEHISLESDIVETRAKPNPARRLKIYDLRKSGSGIGSCVSILPDHYVLIETQRGRSSTADYILDLRFVDPRPFATRKVARSSIYAGIGGATLTALSTALYFMWPTTAQRLGGVLTPVALLASTLVCFALCYYLTKESLLFVSAHGRARVIAITGRWGTIRRAQVCASDLASRIKLAQKQFKQSRQTQLRDEMREHSRLREQGVLTEQSYDEAKRRILQSHE